MILIVTNLKLFQAHPILAAVHIATRQNPIVNRLNKTKVEKDVDHEQERVDRVKAETAVRRAAAIAKVHCFNALRPLLVDSPELYTCRKRPS